YFLSTANWNTISSIPTQFYAHIWAQDFYAGTTTPDWGHMYRRIYYANNALEILAKNGFSDTATTKINSLKSKALFIRAYNLFHILSIFSGPYSESSEGMPGVPIKTSADINTPTYRNSMG